MKEIWKDIDGYDGLYRVSNLGNVQAVSRSYINNLGRKVTTKTKILCQGKNDKGYKTVSISYNGKRTYFMVHRLVAFAFCENPHNFNEVNHIDENKENNRSDNLEWCSRSYNCKFGSGLSKRIEKVSYPVLQFKSGEFVAEYKSVIEAERKTGISKGGISNCCNGKRKTAGGYQWKFKNEEKAKFLRSQWKRKKKKS